MFLASVIFFLFSIPLIIAALNDAASMKIPNWVSVALIAGYFLIVPFVWQGFADFGVHLLVGLTFLVAGFAMFAFGWLGGGDAKLMAAAALWMTWPDSVVFILYTTLFGAALGLFLLVGRAFIPVRVMTSAWMYTMFKDQKKMPYGLAIAAGGIYTISQSAIMKVALAGY